MDNRTNPETICVILGGGRGTRLYPLTKERAKPAVPLGGKYRLIDVPISNCLNSGLKQIHVLTQFNSASLHQHVQHAYQFDRFDGGFVEVLAAEQTMHSEAWYQGTADAVRRNMIHFGTDWDEMLILSGDQLYQMDYRSMLAGHRQTGADVSISVLPVDARQANGLGILKVDETGRVVGFVEKPKPDQLAGLETSPELFAKFGIEPSGRVYLASMGIYAFSRDALKEQLANARHVDFGKDIFPNCLDRYRVQAYLFDGYWEDIGTVRSFHEANLQMAEPHPKFNFRSDRRLVYTAPRTLAPSRINKLSLESVMIADGCLIGEAHLKRCVIGIRSIIGRGVRMSRTMVMGADYYETSDQIRENESHKRPNVGIGDDVIIEDAIIDKNVRIGNDVIIRNPASVDPPETDTYAVRDGVIVVVKNAIIPSGTRIGR